MASDRGQLNWGDAQKILKGAGLAAAGAAATWLLSNWVPTLNQSTPSAMIVAGLASVLLNTFLKFITSTQAAAALVMAVVLSAGGSVIAGEIHPYLSPGPDCENAMVNAIDAAHERVWVQYYGFTSIPVRDALIRAKRRGLDVEVILDRSNLTSKSSQYPELLKAGILVLFDSSHPIAHNKVTICDRNVLLVGSYNPTAQAKRNAENLQEQIDFPEIVEFYANSWKTHKSHSTALKSATRNK